MGASHRIRFFYDWGLDTPFWCGKDAALEKFDVGPIDPELLGLTPATTRPLQDLGSWHDTALNWDYPPDPGPWRQDECERFRTTLECILEKVPGELGADYELVDEPSDTTKTPISTGTLPVQALTWLVGEGSRDRRRPSGPDHQGLGP